ncbi:cytochrome c oxidase assembly protein [Neoaquamicrobium sediminum]|uniref:cytochrome c oxidase assembly protein n=2 Tax=Neoaquamicrobium sediminum TaxID=1849104 RepID=UPI0040381746
MAIFEGILSQHMAVHIAAMNVLAPCVVLALPRRAVQLAGTEGVGLALATVLQVALLWTWHIPAMLGAALQTPSLMLALHGSLFAAALWFWAAVTRGIRQGEWSSMAALLVTGKLFCLLGVLLTFSPRAIYWQLTLLQSCFGTQAAPLVDQQLAGLLMLVACPVVFVGAAIVAARRWLQSARLVHGWRPYPELE